ncbi:putative reverse transcriptase domain-containing protein [Tanacetum coccineum]
MIWGYTTMIASISCVSVICLGDDVNVISSDKAEGSGDWNSPEYQYTAVSKGKKVMNALSFYRMETNEISERYIAQCFVNGLEAFDGEINLAFDENLIPNEFAVKLCLDYEVKKEKKLVKRAYCCLEELPPFVCKMGKSNQNKKRAMENFNLFYQDIGPFASAGRYLTQEEVAKEELAIRISQRYALLEEEGPTVKEYKEAVKRIKGEALKEKEDPGAFIFPIRLEGKVNENALADTGSDINTMPYRIFETLGREDMKKVDRGITMIDHTPAKAMGKLSNVLCQVGVTTIIAKFLILDIPIDHDAPIVVGWGFLRTMGSLLNTSERIFLTFDGVCHQTFRAARFDVLRTAESDSDDEDEYVIKRNKFGAPIYAPRPAPLQEHTTEKPDCHNPNAQEMKPWMSMPEPAIFKNLLYLHPSNGPNSLAVQEKLNGAQNYHAWHRVIENGLSTKRKFRFIGTANEIWKQLKKRFSLSDGSRKYKLNKDTYESKQSGDYALIKQKEEQRLFQFLNRLDEHYSNQRSQILMIAPLLNKFWEKVGYASWHPKYKVSKQFKPRDGQNRGQGQVPNKTVAHVKSGNTSFTPKQFEKLLRKSQIKNAAADEDVEFAHDFATGREEEKFQKVKVASVTIVNYCLVLERHADVIAISSDKDEGSGDWNSSEYQDTSISKGMEAFDGEINLAFDENLISNEFAVKLCLDYEVKKGKRLVQKELIAALKGERYFVKFIINPEEDDFIPGERAQTIGINYSISNFDDVPKSGEELSPFICKMGKSNCNKKRAMEEERHKDKVELDGKTVKEDKEAVKRIKGEALKEKEDPGAFIFPIRLERKVNKNALADTGSDINTMPYRIFETLGRQDMKKVDRGITMIDHT